MNIINKSILNELESHITREKFVRNIHTFMKYLPAQIEELEMLLHTPDMKSIGDKAHMLKGTCGQFGAMRLHEIFKTMELYADQKRLEEIESMVRVLPYEFQLVKELISLSYMPTNQPVQDPRQHAE
jgi:HPt (histidine-containing phosphotransfer) domain-containing protein